MFEKIPSNKKLKKRVVYSLPRGGYIFDSSVGYVQIGSPPETIKDSLDLEKSTPIIFCISDNSFCFINGISLAELEFPIYYNFFIKKKRTIFICSKKKLSAFKQIIKDGLMGSDNIDLNIDFSSKSKFKVPNIKKEISYFVTYTLEEVVDFIPFDNKMTCQFGDLIIKLEEDKEYLIKDIDGKDKYELRIPKDIDYKYFYQNQKNIINKPVFEQPKFGFTCLGASHGFDPLDNTAGFIFWINGSGVMVDPPVNTTDKLYEAKVNPRAIDTVILTHIHADHDSGLFQKILEQDKITVYSTKTVMDSWLEKYSLLSSTPIKEIASLFYFIPITIGVPIIIKDIEFTFQYMIHSIPTIGFTIQIRDKSLIFSGDHLNDPSFLKDLHRSGYLDKDRYNELINFPWESDIIFHEAGIAPIHTAVSYLDSLPSEVKKKIFVYHIALKNFPEYTLLRRCKFGIEESLPFEIKSETDDYINWYIELFDKISIFNKNKFVINDVLLKSFDRVNLKLGKVIDTKTLDEYFYIILSGIIKVEYSKQSSAKQFFSYQLLFEEKEDDFLKKSHIEAETNVKLLKISKESFFSLIKKPSLQKSLKRISKNQSNDSWDALSQSYFFEKMTLTQKIEFEAILRPIKITQTILLSEYQKDKSPLYIYHSGEITIANETISLNEGALLGEHELFKTIRTKNLTFYGTNALLFLIDKEDFSYFYKNNPGFFCRIAHE